MLIFTLEQKCINQEINIALSFLVVANMSSYNLNDEASRNFKEVLVADPALELHHSIKEAAQKVHFYGGDGRPFVPTPFKMTESSAVLNGLVAAAARAVAADRYGIDYQDIEVNTDVATLFLESMSLPTIDGTFSTHTLR